ncbi:hypothetical protein BDR04DRAFT_1126991 [Suillus decipiens]|nr:hypothetical protein BDR04DRAFT_1126991 [Suillus decipiens]
MMSVLAGFNIGCISVGGSDQSPTCQEVPISPEEQKLHQAALSSTDKKLKKVIPDVSVRTAAVSFLLGAGMLNVLSDTAGIISFRAVMKKEIEVKKDMSGEEAMVLGHIQASANEGTWTKQLKAKTEPHQTLIDRCLKLLVQKQLVKAIKAVRHPTRKIYMLAHLEPSVELTGGPWYTDNELDTEFIKLLSTARLHYIRDRVRRPSPSPYNSNSQYSFPLPAFTASAWVDSDNPVSKSSSDSDSYAATRKERKRRRKEESDSSSESDSNEDQSEEERPKRKRKRKDRKSKKGDKRKGREQEDESNSEGSEDDNRKSSASKRKGKGKKPVDSSDDDSESEFDSDDHRSKSKSRSKLKSSLSSKRVKFESPEADDNFNIGGAFVYRAIRQEQVALGWSQTPRGRCSAFDFCRDKGPTNPQGCVYYDEWFNFKGTGEVARGD